MCVLDYSYALQIVRALFRVRSRTLNNCCFTLSKLMLQTILSLISSSSRFPKLQFFAISHRSVTYRYLILHSTIKSISFYSHVVFRLAVFFELFCGQNIGFVTLRVVKVHYNYCSTHLAVFGR